MEPSPGSSARAAYGQACVNCSRAKACCTSRAGGSCERCHRLGKECVIAPSSRRRGAKKQVDANWKTHIEGRLHDLASILDAQHFTRLPLEQNAQHNTTTSGTRGSSWSQTHGLAQDEFNDTVNSTSDNSHISTPATSDSFVVTSSDEHLPLYAIDTGCLLFFRSQHLSFMPIVDLSPQSRAEEIQREWPFMWTSIQAICSTIPGAQSVLRARVQHTLANKLVIQGQGSLDLLVGLLCYMTWSFDLSRGKNHYYTLSNLAVLLAVDLGLDRTVPEGSATVLNCVSSAGGAPRQVADEVPRNHDADRALLGCFAAASTVSLLVRHEPLKWHLRIDDAIIRLSQATQVPGDPTLVAIARVMKMADDTARVTGRESFSVAPQGVAMLFLQSLKSSVQQIKLTLPPELLQHKVVLSYLYSSEAMISEQILFQHTLAQKSSTFDPGRLEALSVCTQAAKCCVENFLSIGADECAGISCFIMLHFSHSLQLLYRLSLLEEPAWDKATMQATINVLSYLNRAINHLSNAARLHKSNNIFSKSAEALKATFPVWSAALKQTTSVPTATRNTAPVYDGPSSVYPMDLNDDSWFTNVFASWTDQDAPIQTW